MAVPLFKAKYLVINDFAHEHLLATAYKLRLQSASADWCPESYSS